MPFYLLLIYPPIHRSLSDKYLPPVINMDLLESNKKLDIVWVNQEVGVFILNLKLATFKTIK